MSTVDKVDNRRNYISLAQLYTAIRKKQHKKFLQFIIKKQNDINYEIPVTDFLELHKPDLIGSNALHLALNHDNYECFNLLLKNQANCNVKNHKQMTVVQRAVEENFSKRELIKLRQRFNKFSDDITVDELNGFVVMQRIIEGKNVCKHDNWRLWGKIEDKYINCILSNCLANKNISKYSNDDRLFHFHAACLTNNMEAFDFFLKNKVDIYRTSSFPIYDGFTPLHFTAKYGNVEMVKILAANRVNPYSSYDKCMSAVDMLVDQNLKIIEWLHAKNNLPYKDSILDYLENEEKLNSMVSQNLGADWTGFSNFHVACTLINTSSIQLICPSRGPLSFEKFLEGDHWKIYERVSTIPSMYPWSGWTALHFAAFFNINRAKLLISSGADVEAKNNNGITPMDILETRAKIDDLLFILSHNESWKCIQLSDGKTKLLDMISSMKDFHTFKKFLNDTNAVNLAVPNNSPLWPGYTTLHLVVIFSETTKKLEFMEKLVNRDRSNLFSERKNCCDEQERRYLERIKFCLRTNANVTAKDVQGRTPIHLAFRHRKMKVVNIMLQYQDKVINPTDDDNLSHLHIACFANDQILVEKLLSNGADVNSMIKSTFKWQCNYYGYTSTDVFDIIGSTPLHLAVASGNVDLVKVLLNHGADINIKDAQGLSPLHRVFILPRIWEVGKELFKESGATNSIIIRNSRLDDPCFKALLESLDNICNELLSSSNLKESIVNDFGLSHLHIAVYQNKVDAVKKLLDLGSDINAVIKLKETLEANNSLFVLSCYDGWKPLDFSRDRIMSGSERVLLERGANFLLPRADGMNRLFDTLQLLYPRNTAFYVNALKENEALRIRLEKDFGWTLLHVACQIVNFELISYILSTGVDVNLRTKDTSPIHPGCTALHILMINSYKTGDIEKMESYIELILEANGRDVTSTDTRGNTTLHRSDFMRGCLHRSYAKSMYMGRLLKEVKSFNVNPINHEGISVFHIACARHDLNAITKFLDQGFDVNQSVEFFGNYLAGRTPLHLAVSGRTDSEGSEELQLQTVKLLLMRGADVKAEDAFGDTPLHVVAAECDPPRDNIFEMIVNYGADVKAKNIHGKTSLESLLSSRTATTQEVAFFLKQACRLNAFNEITEVGYIPLLLNRNNLKEDNISFKTLVLSCPSINEVDCKGRTTIHNVVSTTGLRNNGEEEMIGYFVEKGCDIDRQDKSGMTALHLAARFRNFRGVEALLMYGADADVIDSTGKTAFAYSIESESLCDLIDVGTHDHRLVIKSFEKFFYHMILRDVRVNYVNRQTLARTLKEFPTDQIQLHQDYEIFKCVKIDGTKFILDDFLSETKAIVFYSKLAKEDREAIERFFKITDQERKFYNWRFLGRLQYRKALQRVELVENARLAMNSVLGFPLPHLCYEIIEKFLGNTDLKSLIDAATL